MRTTVPVPVIVEFHSDVDSAQQTAVQTASGVTFLRPAGLMAQHSIVQATGKNMAALASHDEVAYIFPADPVFSGAPIPTPAQAC